MTGLHAPVLRDEAVAALRPRADGRYLDGTYGRGGHAGAILARLSVAGTLLVMDKDPAAIAHARAHFGADERVRIFHGSFATLGQWAETHAGLDGALFDLGVSSPQIDAAERGFSFMADGPLDMRMDPGAGESAAELLARVPERELADLLYRYGEERQSRRIARAIVQARGEAPLTRTGELAALVQRAIGRPDPHKHPATRTFQALRIAVNRELEDLELGLAAAARALRPGGRLAVISFHSLEDRIVKQFIRDAERGPRPVRRGLPPPPRDPDAIALRAVGDAVFPTEAERERNPRARSAVLRVAERSAP